MEPEISKGPTKTTRQYLRKRQVDELQSDARTLEHYLNSPAIQDKGAVKTQLNRVHKALREQSPPDLTGAQKDKVASRAQALEDKIRNGMPSSEEMRKNPPGAVGKHMRWEKENKSDILEWKNTQITLNKGSDDPDLANVERLRPATSSLSMNNAQIPGKSFDIPTPTYMDNYDRIDFENKELRKKLLALEAEATEAAPKEE